MRYAAVILGIIAVIVLLPQDAFARGGREKSKRDRVKVKREVVTEPVVVRKAPRARVAHPPVVVEKTRPSTVAVRRPAARRGHRDRVGHDHGRRPLRRGYHRGAHRGMHRHHARCGFVPGHYEDRVHQVVVPGYYRNEYVPPKYIKRRGPCGITVRVMIRPAGLRQVWVPPCTRTEVEQVWVAGSYHCGH